MFVRYLIPITLFILMSLRAQAVDVTNQLENLGNPLTYLTRGDSRNVWDMQVYEGKIYIGSGSTSANAGPIRIIAYNPATEVFDEETTVPDEAVTLYKVFDGDLYVPACDPRSDGAGGGSNRNKFFRKRNGVWTAFSGTNQQQTFHQRDVHRFDNGVIVTAGNSTQPNPNNAGWRSGAYFTNNDGQSFGAAQVVSAVTGNEGWFMGLFAYQGKLFGTNLFFTDSTLASTRGLAEYNPSTNRFTLSSTYDNNDFIRISASGNSLLPSRLFKPVEKGGALIYPIRVKSTFDRNLNWKATSFYVKPGPNRAPVRVTFPDSAAIGDYVTESGGVVYALANKRISSTSFVCYLYQNTDPAARPNGWEEVMRFNSTNIAKSCAIYNGYVYFGLGHDTADPRGNAGRIYRVPMPGSSLEVGQFDIVQANASAWDTINFSEGFEEPVVIVGPPTFRGGHPSTMRVRNVNSTSFQVQLDEWDYLDGGHTRETVSYLVAEAGTQTIDGVTVEAGRLSEVNHLWTTVTLAQSIPNPVVLCQTASRRGPSAVTTRVRNVTPTSFQVRVQEEQGNDDRHAREVVHYMVLPASEFEVNGFQLKAAKTTVNSNWKVLPTGNLGNEPALLGQMSTSNGPDAAALRIRYNGTQVETFVEEEASGDAETAHTNETVSWVSIELP